MDACAVQSDMEGKYDLVMVYDVLHDVPFPSKLLEGAYKALKQGGQLILQDIETTGSLTENKQTAGGREDW